MAFKTFIAAVLTVAEVNDYLMKQAVIVCTSATRPATPPEGMVIYETDTDRLLVYSGTAWVNPGTGAWTAASPNPTQSTATTTSFNDGSYELVGKRVTGMQQIVFTGGGTSGASLVVGAPQIPKNTGTLNAAVGVFRFLDASAAIAYAGTVICTAVPDFYFQVDGLASYLGASPALPVSASDTLAFNYDYRIA